MKDLDYDAESGVRLSKTTVISQRDRARCCICERAERLSNEAHDGFSLMENAEEP